MAFKRNLKRKLIDKLNGLYEDGNSWWRKIVDDNDVCIFIRNNRLHVLARGIFPIQPRLIKTCEPHRTDRIFLV